MPVTITTLVENTSGLPLVVGEWGQSILVEADGKKILFDTGPTGTVLKNAAALGIDLSTIDKIVLSHGHYDHTGGLLDVLIKLKESGKHPDGIEIIGHPDIFSPKHFYIKDFIERSVGIPFKREDLEALGARFNLGMEPVKISEKMLTTGEITVTEAYEKIDKDLHTKVDGALVPDKLADDLGIIIKSEQGLIVLLGCGHRGIVNTLKHVQKITGISRIYAVIGGTHLISADAEQMQKTVEALKGFNIVRLGVSHCTGLKAGAVMAREFGDAFFFNSAGTKTVL
jgi:7,8-dihydropterin-6-yl-methyl-4-(beta-D-ribofuranosyl)aminobenzene 5'-phosphate synthase